MGCWHHHSTPNAGTHTDHIILIQIPAAAAGRGGGSAAGQQNKPSHQSIDALRGKNVAAAGSLCSPVAAAGQGALPDEHFFIQALPRGVSSGR